MLFQYVLRPFAHSDASILKCMEVAVNKTQDRTQDFASSMSQGPYMDMDMEGHGYNKYQFTHLKN